MYQILVYLYNDGIEMELNCGLSTEREVVHVLVLMIFFYINVKIMSKNSVQYIDGYIFCD